MLVTHIHWPMMRTQIADATKGSIPLPLLLLHPNPLYVKDGLRRGSLVWHPETSIVKEAEGGGGYRVSFSSYVVVYL